MSGARDWFVSDADVQELFRVVRGQLRQTIIEAIRVAADEARAQLPPLGTALRGELVTSLQVIRDGINGTIDEQVAHALRVLAAAQPQLRTQVNDLAQAAGVTASDSAIENLNRRSTTAMPWIIATAVAATIAVGAVGVALAMHFNARDEAEEARRAEAARRAREGEAQRSNPARPKPRAQHTQRAR